MTAYLVARQRCTPGITNVLKPLAVGTTTLVGRIQLFECAVVITRCWIVTRKQMSIRLEQVHVLIAYREGFPSDAMSSWSE
jgi:hypothetical protein